jgi:DNA primase
MRFSPSLLDEIKARLPVSQVVGRRVRLVKSGNEWKGLSPFNAEKTPSFFVNDQKQAWFDFSSGKNGNIFDFVIESEGVSFPEAVERLAAEAGVPLPARSADAERQEKKRAGLVEVAEMACCYFEAVLKGPKGRIAREYLAQRRLTDVARAEFRVGYATAERHALRDHLAGKGVDVGTMVEAGLLVSGPDIPVAYDRFRNRVMFPIQDMRARVVAFGGRTLDPEVSAKYLNSPETPLFHKGASLYNGAAARAAAHQGAPLIAVEGYVDVIAMVTAGFAATVAPLGTALTEDQLALLWKMAAEPVLCFDGDKAGRRAAYRAVDLAMPQLRPGKSLRFAVLPEGQDPDDLVRSGGREAVDEVLAAARPLADMLWLRETEDGRFDTPERRAALEARIGEVAGAIGEESVRRYYRQDLAERLKRLFAGPEPVQAWRGRGFRERGPAWKDRPSDRRFGNRMPGKALVRGQPYAVMSPNLATSSIHRGPRSSVPLREALILQAVLNHPWLLHEHLEELAQLEFRHADAQKAKGVLIDIFAHGGAGDREQLDAALAARGDEHVRARIERAITTSSVWGVQPQAAPDDVLLTWKQLLTLHRQGHSLLKELKDAELALGQDNSKANLDWLNDVRARLSAIDGTEALIEGFGASSGRAARPM